jgi:hypothetical protein
LEEFQATDGTVLMGASWEKKTMNPVAAPLTRQCRDCHALELFHQVFWFNPMMMFNFAA